MECGNIVCKSAARKRFLVLEKADKGFGYVFAGLQRGHCDSGGMLIVARANLELVRTCPTITIHRANGSTLHAKKVHICGCADPFGVN
jgi:hypothetical protein